MFLIPSIFRCSFRSILLCTLSPPPLQFLQISLPFSRFFPYSFPPTVFFISYIIYIRAVSFLPFIFLLLFPSFSPVSLSVYISSLFSCIALFLLLSFRVSVFRNSVSAVFSSCFLSLFLCVRACSALVLFPNRPRILLPELQIMQIIQNLETMYSLRVHEFERNVAVTAQKHVTICHP